MTLGRITTDEAARLLGLSRVTIRGLFRRGVLTGVRRRQGPWSRIYLDVDPVLAYLAGDREPKPKPIRRPVEPLRAKDPVRVAAGRASAAKRWGTPAAGT